MPPKVRAARGFPSTPLPAMASVSTTGRWFLGYVSGLAVFSDTDCLKLDARGNITGFRAIKDFRRSTFSSQLIYQ